MNSTHIASDHEAINEAVTIIRAYLETKWTRQRTPKGLDTALAAASSQPSTTAGIFLVRGGFPIWVAYFLATNCGEGHFWGLAAKRLADEINIHSTAKDAIHDLEQQPKCQRILASARDSNLEGEPYLDPLATALLLLLDHDHDDLEAGRDLPLGFTSNACPKAIASLLPREMSKAVQKSITIVDSKRCPKAGVSIILPTDPMLLSPDATITINILQNKVPYFLLALFGVQVESEGSQRYINYPGGVRLDPELQNILRCCRVDAIKELFGEEIDKAIRSSDATGQFSLSISMQRTDGQSMHDYMVKGYRSSFPPEKYSVTPWGIITCPLRTSLLFESR
ncbi:hypothetical protein F4679DRAFT_594985 [Xylaria curta]|nr:hypothetical protein F4679DRAFT_594985 [Xylaria curta]